MSDIEFDPSKCKIIISGEISMESYKEFAAQMDTVENYLNTVNLISEAGGLEEGSQVIDVELTSAGGEAYAALAFASKIRQCIHPTIVTAHGLVASAAVLILAYGNERRLAKEAWVMVHEDAGTTEGSVTLVEIEIKHSRRMEDQWNQLLADRTKADAETWGKLHKATTYLSPEECLELGLIDEII
jgi:ATP-dependent Clp protease protease subunit